MSEAGDILLIPFPFTDLSASKRRPILALTSSDNYRDFIALPVTSRPQAEHGLALTSADLIDGTLPVASWIRTNRVMTLNTNIVVKKIGRASDLLVIAAVEQLFAYIDHFRRK